MPLLFWVSIERRGGVPANVVDVAATDNQKQGVSSQMRRGARPSWHHKPIVQHLAYGHSLYDSLMHGIGR